MLGLGGFWIWQDHGMEPLTKRYLRSYIVNALFPRLVSSSLPTLLLHCRQIDLGSEGVLLYWVGLFSSEVLDERKVT